MRFIVHSALATHGFRALPAEQLLGGTARCIAATPAHTQEERAERVVEERAALHDQLRAAEAALNSSVEEVRAPRAGPASSVDGIGRSRPPEPPYSNAVNTPQTPLHTLENTLSDC